MKKNLSIILLLKMAAFGTKNVDSACCSATFICIQHIYSIFIKQKLSPDSRDINDRKSKLGNKKDFSHCVVKNCYSSCCLKVWTIFFFSLTRDVLLLPKTFGDFLKNCVLLYHPPFRRSHLITPNNFMICA